MKGKEVTRFGLIGLGGMANYHLLLLSQLENVQITALCDVNEELVRSKCEQYKIPAEKGYTTFKNLIMDPDVDVVISIVPNKYHAEILKDCIFYGKPILTEKPFTVDFKEADELEKLYKENPIPCMVGFTYRFVPSFRYAKKLLEDGKLGTIRHVSLQYLQEWGSAIFQVPHSWRFSKEMSGSGALGDLGSHMVDSARFLVGELKSVSAIMQTIIPERRVASGNGTEKVDVDDITSFMAIFQNGAIGSFLTSRNAIGFGNHLELTIYGDLGTINVCSERPDEIELCLKDAENTDTKFTKDVVPQEYKLNQIQAFIDYVHGYNQEHIASFYDGYENQRVLEAVIESSKSGKMEQIY